MSFFDHEDFNFEDQSESREKEKDLELQNSLELTLVNQSIQQGEFILGSIKLVVGERIPEGKIMIRIDSRLDLKFRNNVGNTVDEAIDHYKETIPNNAFKARVPSKNTKSLIISMFGSKKKSIDAPDSTAIKHHAEQKKQSEKETSRDQSTSRPIENSGGNTSKAMKMSSIIIANKKSKFARKPLKNVGFDENPEIKRRLINSVEANSLRLKKYDKYIFTFSHEISKKSVFIIPFKINIPGDFPISYNHKLNIFNCIDLVELSREKLLKININFSKKEKLSDVHNSLIEENVFLTHKLSAYFVPKSSVAEWNNKKEKKPGDDPIEIFQKNRLFLRSDQEFEIIVNAKSNSCDFKHFRADYSIQENQIKRKMMSLKLPSLIFCCLKPKSNTVGQFRYPPKTDFTIGIDKKVFRKTDHSINCVFRYENKLLKEYDYIDLLLVAKYRINSSSIIKILNDNKKISADQSNLHRSITQNVEDLLKNLRIKRMNLKKEDNFVKKLPLKHTSSSYIAEDSISKIGDLTKSSSTPNKIFFDEIVYNSSLDLIGKRVIDYASESEIVHRIGLNRNDINTALETVNTDFVNVNYFLSIYLSSGEMMYTYKVDEIPIIFQNVSTDYKKLNRFHSAQMYNYFENITHKSKHFFLLPFANFVMGDDKIDEDDINDRKKSWN